MLHLHLFNLSYIHSELKETYYIAASPSEAALFYSSIGMDECLLCFNVGLNFMSLLTWHS
jgi:hypothetical protein